MPPWILLHTDRPQVAQLIRRHSSCVSGLCSEEECQEEEQQQQQVQEVVQEGKVEGVTSTTRRREEEEEGLYLQLETRERVQTNEAKSKRRRASPT